MGPGSPRVRGNGVPALVRGRTLNLPPMRRRRCPETWAAVLAGQRPPDFIGPGLPTSPTTALPGSPRKLAVLARRYARRQQLFHPEDALLPKPVGLAAVDDTNGGQAPPEAEEWLD